MFKPIVSPHEAETPHLSHATTRLVDTASTPMLLSLIQSHKIDSALVITHRLDAYVVGDRSKTDWRNDLATPGPAELGIASSLSYRRLSSCPPSVFPVSTYGPDLRL